jgi:hypothetical protein
MLVESVLWYRPAKNRFMWQRYQMSNGGIFQMMRFGLFGLNIYGNAQSKLIDDWLRADKGG